MKSLYILRCTDDDSLYNLSNKTKHEHEILKQYASYLNDYRIKQEKITKTIIYT